MISLKHEVTTPIVHVSILELRDFDYESILNINQKEIQSVHIAINSKSISKNQFKSTNSRPCSGAIHFHDSLFMVAIPGDSLVIIFEVRADEGFRETVLGTGEFLFHGDPYIGLVQIIADDQTIIGVLFVEIW